MSKRHVLIVDDNEDIRNLIQATLGKAMYDFGIAEHGQEALEYLEQYGLPDLMILDMAMPIMDGFQVLEIIKNDPYTEGIDVIILSAQTNAQIAAEAIDMGARAVIAKPFGPLDLLRTIDEIFD